MARLRIRKFVRAAARERTNPAAKYTSIYSRWIIVTRGLAAHSLPRDFASFRSAVFFAARATFFAPSTAAPVARSEAALD